MVGRVGERGDGTHLAWFNPAETPDKPAGRAAFRPQDARLSSVRSALRSLAPRHGFTPHSAAMQAEMSRLRVVAPESPRTAEPDESTRGDSPSPGGYVKEQRQRRGLSIEQLAAATNIPASSLRLLEEDDFSALPGPVFVKGFLRCCTRALGLPSETVMELLYERDRAALYARRQQQRPVVPQGEPEAAATVPGPRTAPRVKARPAADGGVVRRALFGLPRANGLLWLMIAAFVAVLVMAAFNLAGSGPVGPHT